ncbi:MAG: UPF0262 family protein [Alphaproteobacteria bacterium]|nr:UPF0262 family protein [Alphaproteobacteria bacterium]HPF45626.1 UPF0262 family protein [Emcibacteraceae bacterium]
MQKERRSQRISKIELDDKTIIRRNDDIEHERRVAIFDLLENNRFVPKMTMPDGYKGPYRVTLRMEDNRLAIDLRTDEDHELSTFVLPLSPLRSIIKEYFLVCNSYYSAIKVSNPRHIEAIDLGRRSLHDEGSEILRTRLADKVDIDFDTARRLFTLICVLQIR